MSDPLSVAGLVTGVISLGLQVAVEINKYLDALECREKDVAFPEATSQLPGADSSSN